MPRTAARSGVVLAILISTGLALAQAAKRAAAPAFDVASVRPVAAGAREPIDYRFLPGRFVATNLTLAQLIEQTYDIEPRQLSGGPAWVESDCFNVTGTTGGAVARGTVKLMLQTLLARRFKLRISNETRTGRVYILTAPHPHSFKPPADPHVRPLVAIIREASSGMLSYRYEGDNASLALLVKRLASQLDAPVLDRTGMAGHYDFRVSFAYDSAFGGLQPDPNQPTIFTALQEQLGLRLAAGKGPVTGWVIASAAHPTPN